MSISRLASAAAIAAMLTAPVLVSASDPEKSETASKPAPTVTSKTVPASPMAALKGVKAAPMSSSELADVKGLHLHFFNPGNNTQNFGVEGLHLIDKNQFFGDRKNLIDLGQGPVPPGYNGLCNAATNGNSAIIIESGGGCGF